MTVPIALAATTCTAGTTFTGAKVHTGRLWSGWATTDPTAGRRPVRLQMSSHRNDPLVGNGILGLAPGLLQTLASILDVGLGLVLATLGFE